MTLPPSKLKKLIILEDHEPYLEYLRVCFHRLWCIFIVEMFRLSLLPERILVSRLYLRVASTGTHIPICWKAEILMSILPLGKIVRFLSPLNPKMACLLLYYAVHPELHFVTHIPQTILGEQLVAQLFRCIPEKSWMFKYGRVPMSFILADWVWRVSSLDAVYHCS